MKATDWRFLPFAGGLLDQPERLMDDIMIIEGEYVKLKEELGNG